MAQNPKKKRGNSPQKSVGEERESLRNADPITDEPGAHPVGAGTGAALGGVVAGAAAGMAAGPVGTVAGAIIGGVAGAYAGKAVAEGIDPTVETAHWREAYPSRPYYDGDLPFESVEPTYRFGWESYDPEASFEDRETELERRWKEQTARDEPALEWQRARLAAKDAHDRVVEHVRNQSREVRKAK